MQTLIAVLAGHLTTLLPEDLVRGVAMAIFLVGAVVLFRQAPKADEEEKAQEEEYAGRTLETRTGLKAAGASFLVLFAAEWGDLSQLLTISLIAHYGTRPASSSAPGGRCWSSPGSPWSSGGCCSTTSGSRSSTTWGPRSAWCSRCSPAWNWSPADLGVLECAS